MATGVAALSGMVGKLAGKCKRNVQTFCSAKCRIFFMHLPSSDRKTDLFYLLKKIRNAV
jgi:hypothetical protein